MIGKTLAHYKITSQLGKGGMGEVYQAKDTKLGRDVAIKVLPEEFAKDVDRVARFQREAKLLASLNHPNIAAIHGLEEVDGTNFLVMELVEGQTLDVQIKAGAIPVEEALKLALQIAEALEAAHEKGVIHRDLKPANIKVTPDGKVKVLDFGLAKAFAGDHAEVNLSQSPTLSEAATMQGMILGTAAYMSPEQARGKEADKRADIWAFGVVLFEMLRGQSLFSGEDVTSTLARVLEREPDFSTLPVNLHPKIIEMLERCLEKDPRDRYGSISDARVDIQKVLADPSGVLVKPVTAEVPQKKLRTILPWIAVTAVICLIIAGIAGWLLKPTPPPEPKQIVSFEYDLPEGQQFTRNIGGAVGEAIAISPDGSQFVYSTPEGLFLRSMKELSARPLARIEGRHPFFSPDGQWIGYFDPVEGKLKKIGVSGGAPVVICDTGLLLVGASWNSDNTIVYGDATGGGIKRVSAAGGTPEVLIEGNITNIATEGFPAFPQILPDGKTLLFINVKSADANEIMAYSFESGERKLLFKGGNRAKYLPTGHIVYTITNNDIVNLLAVPFDLDSLETTGGHVALVQGVDPRNFAFSNTGTLVYRPATSAGAETLSTLVWVDRNGNETPLSADPDAYRAPRISPDGKKVALAIDKDGNEDIYVWDIVRETMTRLTFSEAGDSYPLWTSDSKRIAFSSDREGGGVYWKSADGTGMDEKLGSAPDYILLPWSLSADGKTLALTEFSLGGSLGIDFNIGTLSLEKDHEHKILLKEKYVEAMPKISPDGRWMAYSANESSSAEELTGEIYVRPFPDVETGKWQVSQGEGGDPLWSPDGRELFYFSEDSIMAVSVESEPTFSSEKPKVLFKGNYVFPSLDDGDPWDIHPDGRFLMKKTAASAEESVEAPAPSKIIVVTNWFEELKDRVPTP
jgi:serine/threonine protein kinase/Tol biopolymer transport system component